MNKVLFVATVTSHINAFHIPYLKWFKDQGYEVHVASYGNEKIEYCDKHFNIPFKRFPFKRDNIKAYKQLKKIIEDNEYKIIHCHTPVGGVLARLAARKAIKNGTKVIYTAHGFHFFKGAPLINWIIYYPTEKLMAHYTDCIITINNEDYERAKRKLKAKEIEYVHGVGVDDKKFSRDNMSDKEKEELRKKLNIGENDFVIIYPAELSDRKNQGMLIKAVKLIDEKLREKIKILLPGKDSKNGYYQQMVKDLGLENQILFLGFRNDINRLIQISNLAVSTSKQEGLPVNIIEDMFMKIPIIATDCRGNRDLIKNCIAINDERELAKGIELAMKKPQKFVDYNIEPNKLENVIKEMEKIFKKMI